MPVVNTIQLRRDTAANWTSVNPTLAAGEVGYDSTSNKIKIGNGSTAWNSLDYASGGASILVSATEPDEPEVGDVWFNTESGITYVYYDSSWVSVAGSSGAPIISDTAPTDPVLGTQWFNSSTGKSYLYYSNAWVEIDSNGTATTPSGNAIINGGFDIWQRGNSFTNPSNAYIADRWWTIQNGGGGTLTVSRQPFTPGELTNTGSGEYPFFLRFALTGTETGATVRVLDQRIEDVRTLAAQTVTLSFWAKADASRTISTSLIQSFGSGGSSDVGVSGGSFSLTTSWQRFTTTVNLASMATKTIGANSYLIVRFTLPINVAHTVDVWGVQLEAGAVATPFKRNAPSIQAELAACQRYYVRFEAFSTNTPFGPAVLADTSNSVAFINLPVPMRIVPTGPTSIDFANLQISDFSSFGVTVNSAALTTGSGGTSAVIVGLSNNTSPGNNRPAFLRAASAGNAFIGFNAEL